MKKSIKRAVGIMIAFVFALGLSGIIAEPEIVFAQGNVPNIGSTYYQNSSYNPYAPRYIGQCTWFAYGRSYEKLGIQLDSKDGNFLKNAKQWWNQSHYSTGDTARKNSIAVWGNGKWGHVAFVEDVVDGTIYINEANYRTPGAYHGSVQPLTQADINNRGGFLGYIYLDGGSPPQPPVGKFTYANNAKVSGDFFYVRDSNGNTIQGRRVDDGDNITVLDVGYSKQLVLVEYPTSSGTRTGYITNVPSLIKYYYQDEYQNGSTPEPVYDESGNKIGSLDPREKATPIYRKNGMLHVVYSTDKGKNTKSGYVKYNGGFNKF